MSAFCRGEDGEDSEGSEDSVAFDGSLVISEEASVVSSGGGLVLPVGTSVVAIGGGLVLPEGASVVRTVAGYGSGLSRFHLDFRAEGVGLSGRPDFLTCYTRSRAASIKRHNTI